jgi:hypothetical protein
MMAEVAIAAYVRPPDADVLASVLGGVATTNADLSAGVLFSAKADHDGKVQDALEVSLAVSKEQLGRAVVVVETAEGRLAQAQATRWDAVERLDVHRRARAEVEPILGTLEERLPALRAELEATIEAARAAVVELAGSSVVDVPVVVVEGIRVHVALAPRLQALLDAAYAESANACSPPTALPGTSLHERGLAIDFHAGGRSITSRSDPAFQWLAANAAAFGLFNLPSEPWHWSVNGN